MTLEFDGRVAVVTGAGRGLGRGHALALAGRGARVVVNDLEMPDETVDEITAAGGHAVGLAADVATIDGARAVVAAALDMWDAVDVVVNNAGFIRDKSFAKLTADDWDAVIAVHLRGSFLVSQAAFPHMKERGYGRLVHTTSPAGLFGNFGQANYGAAKMGIVGLSRTLAVEGLRTNIVSNVVSPVAATPAVKDLGLLGPLGDLLLPEQVTSMVVLLASEACPGTGEVYSVVGGRYARVFTAVTPGWFAGRGTVPQPEDVLARIEEIRQEDGYVVPVQAFDEMAAVAPLLEEGT